MTRSARRGLPLRVHWRSCRPLFLEASLRSGAVSAKAVLVRCNSGVDAALLPGSGTKIVVIKLCTTPYRVSPFFTVTSLSVSASTPLICSAITVSERKTESANTWADWSERWDLITLSACFEMVIGCWFGIWIKLKYIYCASEIFWKKKLYLLSFEL